MILNGKSVFGGIAIGKLSVYQKKDKPVKRYQVKDVTSEIERFRVAKEKAKKELAILYEDALKEVGKEDAAIFKAHQVILEDMDYVKAITNMIETQSVNAEFAVATTSDEFVWMFAATDDEYVKERTADVRDICKRVLSILQGRQKEELFDVDMEEPIILLAEDLTPGETVQLDKSKVLSFVTRYGSTNSHTAILARTMNIPALIGVDFPEDADGKYGIVDGYSGTLIVEPEEAVLEEYRAKKEADENEMHLLQTLKGKENITLDGKRIELYANIGSVEDVASVLANDAGGIGLFRSEFLYLEAQDYPTEEVQFAAYKAVAEKMAGRKVVIRTLDIGADKQVDYFQMVQEENPAMGYRGIRICLDRPEIFKTQLRAIYRASNYGNIAILFPMITSVEEVQRIKEIIEEVKGELAAQGIPYKDCEIGIMIETPAAVLISDLLAREVDFFSVGTNDLTQYTLAIDRKNAKLDKLYNPHHEAVLRMLQMAVDNAHAQGCWIGICGELGADIEMTEVLLRMGFDELSVSPSMILKMREAIRGIRL